MKALAPAVALLLALVAPAGAAEKEPIYTGLFSDLAAGGYDVVAYFERGEATKGSKEHSHEWRGATWRFASADHLTAFRDDPERWAPQYGGYCAWAVSQGYTAKGDPEFWKIVDGKLYLNYDRGVQERWLADTAALIAAADRNWPGVLEDR